MDGLALLQKAHEAGLTVKAEGDRLIIRGPRRAEPVARLLIGHKGELLAALRPPSKPSPSVASSEWDASDWCGYFGERAGLAEFDGGAPRAWAEALARLDPNSSPGDVPLKRWRRFIDDCGRFLDSGWAERATALGWTPPSTCSAATASGPSRASTMPGCCGSWTQAPSTSCPACRPRRRAAGEAPNEEPNDSVPV